MPEQTVELVCASEKVVIGRLVAESGLRITAKSAVRYTVFNDKWKPVDEKWAQAQTDGATLRCTRCSSELYLKALNDSLETALAVKMALTLGGSKIA